MPEVLLLGVSIIILLAVSLETVGVSVRTSTTEKLVTVFLRLNSSDPLSVVVLLPGADSNWRSSTLKILRLSD